MKTLQDLFLDELADTYDAERRTAKALPRFAKVATCDELKGVLLDPVCLNRGLFRSEVVATMIEEHVSRKRDHAYKLWALLMLELWFRKHLDAA